MNDILRTLLTIENQLAQVRDDLVARGYGAGEMCPLAVDAADLLSATQRLFNKIRKAAVE